MEERLDRIERTMKAIEKRNQRVESDKAWEVSLFRRFIIAVATYVIAAFFLFSIGSAQFFHNALIPTIGYLLSTLSLPAIKQWWIQSHRK